MYRFMNEEELEIRQMKHLKMVHLYRLADNDALAVYYDDDKQMNLCAMDANYHILMETVLSLYSLCEAPDTIIMDESTRALLDRAVAGKECHTAFFNRIGQKYLNTEGTSAPTFASEGILRQCVMPMIKYYLNQLYHMWDYKVVFEKEPRGWRRNCVLKLREGEDTLILPIKMDFAQGNECRIIVANFLKDLTQLTSEITYREDRLYVWFECPEMGLLGESHYEITGKGINAFTSIRVDGKLVYHQNEPVEILTPEDDRVRFLLEKKALLEEAEISLEQTSIYQLPWKGLVLCSRRENSSNTIQRTDYDMIYIESYTDKIALRQFSYSLIEDTVTKLKLRTDGAIMRKLYFGDRMKGVETFFLPVGCYSGWDYKKYLENRYFYHETEDTK